MPITDQTAAASRRWTSIPLPVLVAFACLLSFLAGYLTATHRLDDRAYDEGRRRFRDFLLATEDLDIRDRRRLTDLICTVSEAEWEDRDAEQIAGQADEQTNAPAGDAP